MPHIRHCIDILRQELMCTFSLDVHTFTWVEHYSTPMADFMLQRQCRRWDDIVRWKESHQMSDEDNERVDRLQKPHGVFENALPGGAADLLDQTAEWLKHSHVA
ncbi:hypothetical protein HII31_05850 [Pseudocercospora fuligena]|uniref:Uncharacterized protein n=1 Tax=Pseudocercospora fuligena TaxID=685502 RepID=A0A8H6RLH1_9PEZI|nr:hypothetical protein HII31_05850 [Pseudocercospora fuligena]